MSAIAWTVLGLIGTTILTAVVGKLVNLAFERSANLIVTVTINQSFKAPLLSKEVYNWRRNSMPSDEWLKEPMGAFDKYSDYFRSDVYIRLEVKNNSKKKLTGLTFCVHTVSSGVMQIGEGELIPIKGDIPVVLGELQPRREMLIHILVGSFWSYTTKDIGNALVFSADELGRVKYKFPLPLHLSIRFKNRIAWTFALVNTIFAAIVLASSFMR